MTTFAILAPPTNPKVDEFLTALNRVFPEAYHQFAPGQYVAVKKDATSEQVAKEMGAKGEIGDFVVFTTAGHFGWHNKSLWEWLAVRGAT